MGFLTMLEAAPFYIKEHVPECKGFMDKDSICSCTLEESCDDDARGNCILAKEKPCNGCEYYDSEDDCCSDGYVFCMEPLDIEVTS